MSMNNNKDAPLNFRNLQADARTITDDWRHETLFRVNGTVQPFSFSENFCKTQGLPNHDRYVRGAVKRFSLKLTATLAGCIF